MPGGAVVAANLPTGLLDSLVARIGTDVAEVPSQVAVEALA